MMLTPTMIILLILSGSMLLLVLIALIRYFRRRAPIADRPTVRRSVVLLVSDDQLLVMQRMTKGGLRSRLEVPKGKAMRGEDDVDAAFRECFEECGLRPAYLQFLTSFHTRRRNGKQRGMEFWNAFWGHIPPGTVMPFIHRVKGKGRDRGRVYYFRLVPLAAVELYPPLDVPIPALRQALADSRQARFP